MQANYGRAARLLFQLPTNCKTFVAIEPANQWGWQEILLNKIAYLLEVLVWQKSKDAQKKAPHHKPKLWLPDFMKKAQQKSEISKGAVSADVDTIKEILAKPRK